MGIDQRGAMPLLDSGGGMAENSNDQNHKGSLKTDHCGTANRAWA
jgi:hypothetical protein